MSCYGLNLRDILQKLLDGKALVIGIPFGIHRLFFMDIAVFFYVELTLSIIITNTINGYQD